MTLDEGHYYIIITLLFVAITYGKVSFWLWKSLKNSGNFFPTLWPPWGGSGRGSRSHRHHGAVVVVDRVHSSLQILFHLPVCDDRCPPVLRRR